MTVSTVQLDPKDPHVIAKTTIQTVQNCIDSLTQKIASISLDIKLIQTSLNKYKPNTSSKYTIIRTFKRLICAIIKLFYYNIVNHLQKNLADKITQKRSLEARVVKLKKEKLKLEGLLIHSQHLYTRFGVMRFWPCRAERRLIIYTLLRQIEQVAYESAMEDIEKEAYKKAGSAGPLLICDRPQDGIIAKKTDGDITACLDFGCTLAITTITFPLFALWAMSNWANELEMPHNYSIIS